MAKETDIIKLAKIKNGKDFEKWLEATPTKAVDIKDIRKITSRLNYSMVEEAAK